MPFGFETPPHLVEAVARAMRDGFNGYTPSPGIPQAREAVAGDFTSRGLPTAADRVVLTSGTSEGIELTLGALANDGDEVLVPTPTYPLYTAVIAKLGARAVFYRTDPDHGWQPDLDHLRRLVTPSTRAIVVIDPNNPTGAVYPRETRLALLEIGERHGILAGQVEWKEIPDRKINERNMGMKPQCTTAPQCLKELARVMDQFGIEDALDAQNSKFVKFRGVPAGRTQLSTFDCPQSWQFAIAEVEGKPVFLGDELYDAKGAKCQALAQSDALSRRVLVEYCDKSKYWFAQSELSWNPPRPKTVMVELPYEIVEFHSNSEPQNYHRDEVFITHKACKKALESIK